MISKMLIFFSLLVFFSACAHKKEKLSMHRTANINRTIQTICLEKTLWSLNGLFQISSSRDVSSESVSVTTSAQYKPRWKEKAALVVISQEKCAKEEKQRVIFSYYSNQEEEMGKWEDKKAETYYLGQLQKVVIQECAPWARVSFVDVDEVGPLCSAIKNVP